jgi:hypothetical protein
MHTLAELSEDSFRNFEGGQAPPVATIASEPALEDPSAFVLEKYLEDFIVTNFATIFKNELRIYEDADGNDGQQYSTDIGPIDILAQTRSGGSFVVIELKKGRPSDQVVGQVLRYMGWVKKNLCAEGQAVKGLVICRDPDPKLSYALEMTNNIDVQYYSVLSSSGRLPNKPLDPQRRRSPAWDTRVVSQDRVRWWRESDGLPRRRVSFLLLLPGRAANACSRASRDWRGHLARAEHRGRSEFRAQRTPTGNGVTADTGASR